MGLGIYPSAVRRRAKAAGDSSTAASPRTSSSAGKLTFQLSPFKVLALPFFSSSALMASVGPQCTQREYRLCELIWGVWGLWQLFVIAQFSGILDSGSMAIRPSVGLAYRSVEIFLTSDSLRLFLGVQKSDPVSIILSHVEHLLHMSLKSGPFYFILILCFV